MSVITPSYSCSTGTVTINWNSVLADSYSATVVDSTGMSRNCTTTSISCQIDTLKCGQRYQIYVTAFSGICETTSNTSTMFDTGEQSRAHLQMCICLSGPFLMNVLSVPHHQSSFHTMMHTPHILHTHTPHKLFISISLFCGKLLRLFPWCPMLSFNTSQSKALYNLLKPEGQSVKVRET